MNLEWINGKRKGNGQHLTLDKGQFIREARSRFKDPKTLVMWQKTVEGYWRTWHNVGGTTEEILNQATAWWLLHLLVFNFILLYVFIQNTLNFNTAGKIFFSKQCKNKHNQKEISQEKLSEQKSEHSQPKISILRKARLHSWPLADIREPRFLESSHRTWQLLAVPKLPVHTIWLCLTYAFPLGIQIFGTW